MPKTVAVIGASNNRNKFGNKALRAFAHHGDTVLAINPNESEVEGHKTFASVLDVPGPIDMATVYIPPHRGLAVMDQIAEKGDRRGLAESGRRRARSRCPRARPRPQGRAGLQHRGDRREPV